MIFIDNIIYTRPYASPGGWLCFLLPLALLTSYLHAHKALPACDTSDGAHSFLIVAAIGMCLRTVCFLFNAYVDTGTLSRHIICLLPSIVISLCLGLLHDIPWITSAISGFVITALYQYVYISVLCGLPKTFTLGEAAILVQGLVLFVLNTLIRLYELSTMPSKDSNEFAQLNALMISALLFLLVVCLALALVRPLRKPVPFYLLMVLLALAVTCAPVTKPLPLIALLGFIFRDQKRVSFD